MKIKTIAVKRHTSVPCIPLTPQFVVRVFKTYAFLDDVLKCITRQDDNGELMLLPNHMNNPEAQATLSAYETLGDIITAFESDCEPEQN